MSIECEIACCRGRSQICSGPAGAVAAGIFLGTSPPKVGIISRDKKVLCVDDEAVGLAVRRMLLESQGYSVLTAENGSKALAVFAAQTVDLVVLDYSMPGMNGDIVAEKMKALKASVPIIMLSAYVDLPHDLLRAADKSVTKGEPPTVLLEAIVQLLNRGPDFT